MKRLKILVLMQLKDKLNFSYLKSVKATISKIVLNLFKFVLITSLIYFGFYILSYLRLVSISPGIPIQFMVVVITIMLILSMTVCSFGLMKNLYFSKDNSLLLTMPVEKTSVFTSKLIVYYIYELIRNLNFILPIFLAYALINKLPIVFYFWLVIMYFFVILIPVVVGSLFSIPLMYILGVIKKFKWLEYSLLIFFISGIVLGLVYIINRIPENFDLIGTWGTTFWKIQDFLSGFNKIFVPFVWVLNMVVGNRYGISNKFFYGGQFLITICVFLFIAVILLITYFLVRPMFFKMVSRSFEFKKEKTTKKIKNTKNFSIVSYIKKELLLIYRTPDKFYNLLFLMLGLPIAIFLLNKLYSAMDTRLTGAYMTISFNILIILLFVISSNVNIAHFYSEEGSSVYLFKTNPKSYLHSLSSKLLVNGLFVTLSILVTSCIFGSFVKLKFLQKAFVFFVLESVYLAHLFWSAELDIMNPQVNYYQTTGTHHNNPNDIKSTIIGFVLAVVFALLTFFFIKENQFVVWYKIFIFAVLLLVLRVWLYKNKVNVYFKEK